MTHEKVARKGEKCSLIHHDNNEEEWHDSGL